MRAALLCAVVVLAGCLENAQDAPSGDLTLPSLPTLPDPAPVPTPDPVPERVPTPPLPLETLHRNKRAADGDRALVVVPAGVAALRFVVEANASWTGEVRLVAPDGATRAACDGEPCARVVGQVAVGDWHVEYDASVPGEVVVSVVAEPAKDETRHLLYERTRDLGDAFDASVDHLRVQAGYDRIVLEARFEGVDAAEVALVDPDHRVAAVCRPAADPCVAVVPLPREGSWRVQHGGDGAGSVRVAVHGLAAARLEVESNYTALQATYSYLKPNETIGFYVREGHQRMGFVVGFRRDEGAAVTGDPVAVMLRDPAGQVVARCILGDVQGCPPQVPAAVGLWTVAFVGPDEATSVDASAFVFAPGEPDETEPAPTPEPWQPWSGRVYEATRSMWPKWYDHVPLLGSGLLKGDIEVRGNGTMLLLDPGGEPQWTCRGSCRMELRTGWSGVWRVAYAGDEGATASVALDFAAEDLVRGGDGRFFTAYEERRFPGEQAGLTQGIVVPPGWSRMHVWVNQTGEDMGGAVTLRHPDGAASACSSTCAFDVEAAPGVFEVAYDPQVAARVTARIV